MTKYRVRFEVQRIGLQEKLVLDDITLEPIPSRPGVAKASVKVQAKDMDDADHVAQTSLNTLLDIIAYERDSPIWYTLLGTSQLPSKEGEYETWIETRFESLPRDKPISPKATMKPPTKGQELPSGRYLPSRAGGTITVLGDATGTLKSLQPNLKKYQRKTATLNVRRAIQNYRKGLNELQDHDPYAAFLSLYSASEAICRESTGVMKLKRPHQTMVSFLAPYCTRAESELLYSDYRCAEAHADGQVDLASTTTWQDWETKARKMKTITKAVIHEFTGL